MLGLNHIPFWLVSLISIAVGLLSSIIVQFLVKPYLVKWIKNRSNQSYNLSVVGDSSINVKNSPATKAYKITAYHMQPKFEKSNIYFQNLTNRF